MGHTEFKEFVFQLARLECRENIFRRHPSPGWWSEPDRFSVDQAIALVAALGVMGLRRKLKKFLISIALRGSLMTNTRRNGATKENHGQPYKAEKGKQIFRDYSWKLPDFFGPRDWAAALRILCVPHLYPIIFMCDILLLLNAMKRRASPDTDPLNYLIRTRLALWYQPTPLSRLVLKIEKPEALKEALIRYSMRVGFPYDELFQPLLEEK
jgi:hypothetical protein